MRDEIIKYIRLAATVMGGVLTALLGGWDLMLQVLVLFVILDYITGVTAAFVEKRLNSEVGFRGICKKILLFVPIMLACALDELLDTNVVRSMSLWFYIANEGLSIVENLGRMDVLIPEPLRRALEQLKEREE